MYDRLATDYDRSGLADHSIQLASHLEDILGKEKIPPGAWIDLGCGTGALLARGLAEQRGAGVDLSLGMLRAARHVGARVAQGNVQSLPFRAESFILATALFDVTNHLLTSGELSSFFREVETVLAPGGFFLFDSNSTAHLRLWDGVRDELPLEDCRIVRSARFQESSGRLSVEWTREDSSGACISLGTLVERAHQPGAIESALRKTGFDRIEKRVLTRGRGRALRYFWKARRPNR